MNEWIQTFTGKQVWPLDPANKANHFCIEDIAHALALKCRFTGHCRTFYSIAEHSVRVAELVPADDKAWALLHDAAEAYLPDVARPIKGKILFDDACGREPFAKLEDLLLRRLGEKFGLKLPAWYQKQGERSFPPDPIPDVVHQADLILLRTEARDLMAPPPESWNLTCPVLNGKIVPWSWQAAEELFLAAWREGTKAAAKDTK